MSRDLDARLLAFIEREGPGSAGDPAEEAAFGDLALELFAHQYESNLPYRRFCRARRAEPGRLRSWTEIPAVPLQAFKDLTLACEPPEAAAAVFMTSGSTDATRRGRNFHPHLRLYDASLRVNFARRFLPDRGELRLLILNPAPELQPNSSIAYFFGRLVDGFGAQGSGHFVDDAGLQLEPLLSALREAEATGTPVGLLGTSFAHVHLLDALAERQERFRLPSGSRLLDTGGFKGRSREVAPEDLRVAFADRLGLPPEACVNYYGMTEISTQYYDDSLRAALSGGAGAGAARHKVVPPWARIRVLDPETRREVDPGEKGVLVHYDLANRGSCLAVMAEDVGYAIAPEGPATGFVLLGRAEGTEARGCSIALDELLQANAGTPA